MSKGSGQERRAAVLVVRAIDLLDEFEQECNDSPERAVVLRLLRQDLQELKDELLSETPGDKQGPKKDLWPLIHLAIEILSKWIT